jgi:2,3-bisphosphoglycerate-independent phosphoglycerate mutase
MKKSCVLVILDGFGIGENNDTNPIYIARLKSLPSLGADYPLTSLDASGPAVGLSYDEVGGSEVGHLTLGSGRIIYQNEPRINFAIQDGSFFTNEALLGAFRHAKKFGSSVHLIGLLTKNNTHASLYHLNALLEMAKMQGASDESPPESQGGTPTISQANNSGTRVKLDLFTDGKDSPPGSIRGLLPEIPRENISSLIGRCYAMDRNKKWAMTERAYAALTAPGVRISKDMDFAITKTLEQYSSEEFLPPIRLMEDGEVRENDAIIFFNFRADGMRQLAEAFALPGFSEFASIRPGNLYIASLIQYEKKLPIAVAFPEHIILNTLGETISRRGLSQLRLTESYRTAHVTYYFNGYREVPFDSELRVIVPSLPIPHPEEKPEMMASAITDRLLSSMRGQAFDFILVNYANADVIAHTGNFAAGVKAARVLDEQIAKIAEVALTTGTLLIITSDHGNLERMINPMDGSPETQHDSSPVPIYFIHPTLKGRKFYNVLNLSRETIGTLADVAPTILEFLQIPAPPEMTGKNILGFL